MVTFTTGFWNKLVSIKVVSPNKTNEQINDKKNEEDKLKKSQEALGEVLDKDPPTGTEDTKSDSSDDSSSDDTNNTSDDSDNNDDDTGGADDASGDDFEDMGTDFGDDGSGDGGGDDSSDDSSDSSGGGSSDGLSLDNRKPGENPFADMNGKELIIQKIQELASNIDSAVEAISKLPKVSSVVVNNLTELKDEVSKLVEIVYTVPLEETLVRYELSVRAYEAQTKDLSILIDNTLSNNTEEV